MKKVIFIILILISEIGFAQDITPTKIFLLRHTETEEDGTRDPALSEKGYARVYQWLSVLKNEKIDAFYATNLRRTQALVSIIANARGIQKIHTYKKELDVEQFLKEIKGKTVLVAGHSNTTPFLVNKIIGYEKFKQIDHNDYNKLFIITYYNKNQVSVSLLNIPFKLNQK